jgi:hypothetical protein
MSQDIREIIKQEYIKSASDPVHFMKKYCYIQHPTRGRVLFSLECMHPMSMSQHHHLDHCFQMAYEHLKPLLPQLR